MGDDRGRDGDHDQRSGLDLVGDSRSGNQPAWMGDGTAPGETKDEVKDETETETQRVDFPAAPTGGSVAHCYAGLRPDSRLAVGGEPDAVGRHAVVRDRQPVPVFDSATFPVQESSSLPAEPVQAEFGLPVEDKGLPAQPVQAKLAACPVLASWRQVEGIWLPRYFTAVPHLKYERVSLSSTFKPVAETKTGLQIQWNTACSVCEKRFRPVAGFITILHIERMKEMNDDEQQNFVARIIQDKFAAGVSGQHPKCAG